MRSAMLPSSAIKFGAKFIAPSRIIVVGLVAMSKMSHATLGTFLTYRCSRASESTKQMSALESSRFLILYTFATAAAFVAAQPMTQTVSVV